jgi:hypothetical protein
MIIQVDPRKWFKPAVKPLQTRPIPNLPVFQQQEKPAKAEEKLMSFLSTIGKDVKAVFNWISSPRGQAIITEGENVVKVIDPALSGIIDLADSWLRKVITTETLATAAGSQSGSGVQKAAAVLTAMQPEISVYFPGATATQLQNANKAIVDFLNAFDHPASLTPAQQQAAADAIAASQVKAA